MMARVVKTYLTTWRDTILCVIEVGISKENNAEGSDGK
jgi:hypothetical protein